MRYNVYVNTCPHLSNNTFSNVRKKHLPVNTNNDIISSNHLHFNYNIGNRFSQHSLYFTDLNPKGFCLDTLLQLNSGDTMRQNQKSAYSEEHKILRASGFYL